MQTRAWSRVLSLAILVATAASIWAPAAEARRNKPEPEQKRPLSGGSYELDWADQSPMGMWRGYLTCGKDQWPLQITVSASIAVSNSATVLMADLKPQVLVEVGDPRDRADLFVKRKNPNKLDWFRDDSSFEAKLRFDPSKGEIRIVEPTRKRGSRGHGLIEFDLRFGPGHTLAGRASEVPGTTSAIAKGWPSHAGCTGAELARYDGGSFSIDDALRYTAAQGKPAPNISPREVAAAAPAIRAVLSQCSGGTAKLDITVPVPRATFENSPLATTFFERMADNVVLQCPSARKLMVSYGGADLWQGGSAEWPALERKLWAFAPGAPGTATAQAGAGNTPAPTPYLFAEPVSTLPLDKRTAVLRERVWAAARAYRERTGPLQSAIAAGIDGREVAWLAHRFLALAERAGDVPPPLLGKAHFVAGMVSAGFIASESRLLEPTPAAAASSFMQCARLSQYRECALLAEYFQEWSGHSGTSARQMLASAQRTQPLPEAELQASLQAMQRYVIAKAERVRFPAAHAACLAVEERERVSSVQTNECARTGMVRDGNRMMEICEARVTQTTVTKYDVTVNRCSHPVVFSLRCDPGKPAAKESLKAGEVIEGAFAPRPSAPSCSYEREFNFFPPL